MTQNEHIPLQPTNPELPEIEGSTLSPEGQLAAAIVDSVAAHAEQVAYPKGSNPRLKLWLPSADEKGPAEQVVLTQSSSASHAGKFSPNGDGVMIDYKQGRTRRSFMVRSSANEPFSVTEFGTSGGNSVIKGQAPDEMTVRLKSVMEQGKTERPRGRVARYVGALLAKRNTRS